MSKKSAPPPPRRVLISVAEAAARLDVHPITLRRWIADGRIVAFKVGPVALRLDAADVDALAHQLPIGGAA